MKLVLSEEEQFLKDTAKNFAEERSPISHFRSLRDNNDRKLWDKDLWSEMVKLGCTPYPKTNLKYFQISKHENSESELS